MASMDSTDTSAENKQESSAQDSATPSLTEDDSTSLSASRGLSSSIAGLSLQPDSARKDGAFQDPTPRTPPIPDPRSRSTSAEKLRDQEGQEDGQDISSLQAKSPQKLDLQDTSEQRVNEGVDREMLSSPEIKHIMDQFQNTGDGSDEKRREHVQAQLPENVLGKEIRHPPRSSSLEPIKLPAAAADASHHEGHHAQTDSSHSVASPGESSAAFTNPDRPAVAATRSHGSVSNPQQSNPATPISGRPPSLNKALPPEPDPEPDLPFDFHRFLEQLRHRSADPVAKFLRSFLVEFSKKQWMAHEQTKIIGDFLAFITNKMAQCEVWQGVSDAEFDNAREGMEKLVMNRLYSQTFSPAIPPPPSDRGKRRPGERGAGPGRRGQHQEDVERDSILSQKVQIYQWVREEHLDLKPVSDSGRRFLTLAQQGVYRSGTRFVRNQRSCIARAHQNQLLPCTTR